MNVCPTCVKMRMCNAQSALSAGQGMQRCIDFLQAQTQGGAHPVMFSVLRSSPFRDSNLGPHRGLACQSE